MPNGITKTGGNAAGKMNAALLTQCIKIRGLVAEANKEDLERRHAISVGCREVRDGANYGDKALRKLALYLGWTISDANEYASVADSWHSEEEFNAVAARKDKFGKPLEWYHCIELAQETNADRRRVLLEHALEDGWSFDDLLFARESTDSDDVSDNESGHGSDEGDPAAAMESHKMTPVKCGEMEADIDEEISPLICEIWKAGILTTFSCQDTGPGWVWIAFSTAADAELFLDIVAVYEEGIRRGHPL